MERNHYLAETHKGIKHSYSYDMQTGKYYLQSGDSNKQLIHKIGKFPSKFKTDGSGVWNTKNRLDYVKKNPENEVYRHHVPNLAYHKKKSFYTPAMKKFSGYAQRPRAFKDDGMPEHLRGEAPLARKSRFSASNIDYKKRAEQAERVQVVETEPLMYPQLPADIPFFRSSLISMVNSRPSIRKPKRSCYNHRCHDPNSKETQYQSIVEEMNRSQGNMKEMMTKATDYTPTRSIISKSNANFSTGF